MAPRICDCPIYARRAPSLSHEAIPSDVQSGMYPKVGDVLRVLGGDRISLDVALARSDVMLVLSDYELTS